MFAWSPHPHIYAITRIFPSIVVSGRCSDTDNLAEETRKMVVSIAPCISSRCYDRDSVPLSINSCLKEGYVSFLPLIPSP